MKKFYFFLLFIYAATSSFAAPVIKAVNNGNWNTVSVWNLNRLPQVGDTIEIPAGKTVMISDDQNLNGFVYLKLYGKLGFQNNNSTLNLGAASVIYVFTGGQIMGGGSASQKIRLNGLAIFQGDDASINGPMMANVTTNGFQFGSEAILPVKFIGFTLTQRNLEVLVQWSTSEEINSHGFEVERSLDGRSWTTIGRVSAAGNSQTVHHYVYTDKQVPAAVTYYRIRQVDQDGRSVYTPVKSVAAADAAISVAAVNNKVLVQFPSEVKGNITIRFVSVNGQVADQQLISNASGQVVLHSKVTGNYIISISNGLDIHIAKQVIL